MSVREDAGIRVATSNGPGLVALLYEGLIENLEEISLRISDSKEYELVNERLENSREILAHLMATLGNDNEISDNTKSIYMYVNSLMTDGYNKKDKSKFLEAIIVLKPLLEAWREVSEIEKSKEDSSIKKPSVVAGMTYGKNNISEYVQGSVKDWDKG